MRRTGPRIATAVVAVAIAVGCPGSSLRTDGGVGSQDVSPPDAVETGSWAPHYRAPTFEPRIVEWHPSVICAPLSLAYAPAGPAPEAPGTLRWVRDPFVDPETSAALEHFGVGHPSVTEDGLTGTSNGGFSFRVSHRVELGLAPDATFAFLVPRPSPATGPTTRVDDDGTTLARDELNYGGLATIDPTNGFTTHIVGPAGHQFSSSRRTIDSRPVVFPEAGVVVWLSGDDTLVSSCIHTAAVRWAVRFDPVTVGDWYDIPPKMVGLSDGGVLVELLPGYVARIGVDGTLVESRFRAGAFVESMSSHCGALVSSTDADGSYFEWWNVDGLAAGARMPLEPAATSTTPVATADCRLLVVRQQMSEPGDPPTPQELTSYGPSGWTVTVPGTPPSTLGGGVPVLPLADGAALLVGSNDEGLWLSIVESSGAVRWTRGYPETGMTGLVTPLGRSLVLMPDGVLYVLLERHSVSAGWTAASIVIGSPPAELVGGSGGFGGSGDWGGTGANWARTSAPLP